MKQLFLSIVAVGLLATASWAGSEVEPPVEVKPDWLVIVDGDKVYTYDIGSRDCVQTIVMDPNPNIDVPKFNGTYCK